MYKKPSRRWVALKAAYLLPLGALSLVAFARPQAMTEIEETVEQESTHYAAVMQPLVTANAAAAEPVVAAEPTAPQTAAEPMAAEPAEAVPSLPDEPDDWTVQMDDHAKTDANLVQADLKENPDASVATPVLTEARGMAVLDSVMRVVGARKIADGAYIGHFQPSLNNDTVRLAQVEFLDKNSRKTLVKTFPYYAADPYAYRLMLQAGTRKDERGYYIRYLTPLKATDWTYDQPKVIND